MKANLYKRFIELLPGRREIIGDVIEHNDDGTSTIATLDGQWIRARGQDVDVGLRAFVNDGRVTGQAPNLPSVTQEV